MFGVLPIAILPSPADDIEIVGVAKSKVLDFIENVAPLFLKKLSSSVCKLNSPLPLKKIPAAVILGDVPSFIVPPLSVDKSSVVVSMFKSCVVISNPFSPFLIKLLASTLKLNSPLPVKKIPFEFRFVGMVVPSAITPVLELILTCSLGSVILVGSIVQPAIDAERNAAKPCESILEDALPAFDGEPLIVAGVKIELAETVPSIETSSDIVPPSNKN